MGLFWRIRWIVGLVLALGAGAQVAYAQNTPPLVLQGGVDTYRLAEHLEVLNDHQGLTLAQVQSQEVSARFTPNGPQDPNPGFIAYSVWLRLVLQNHSPQDTWVLRFGNATIDHYRVYVVDAQGLLEQTLEGGDNMPFAVRQNHDHTFAHTLHIPPGASRRIYVELLPEYVTAPLVLYSPQAYETQVSHELILFGVFYGALGVMFFYNLFLFFSIRDSSYLYYLGFLLASMFLLGMLKGLAFMVLWPDHPEWNNFMMALAITLEGIGLNLFSRKFLNTKMLFGALDGALLGMIGAYGMLLLIFNWLPVDVGFILVDMGVVSGIPFLFGVACIAWYKGYAPARFYLLSMSLFMVGGLSEGMRVLGWVPHNLFTHNGLLLGALAESVLLSFALADRYNTLRSEKVQAQADLVESLRRENEMREQQSQQLEQLVEARTAELRQVNLSKDRLFSIIAHDLKNPFASLISTSTMLTHNLDQFDKDELQEFSGRILSTSQHTYRLLENLLHWARLQTGQLKPFMENFPLSVALAPELALLSETAKTKNITLRQSMAEDLHVLADPHIFRTVLRNLVANAIKFSHPGSVITIQAQRQQDWALLSIMDHGMGIAAEAIPGLFDPQHGSTLGTAREEGTGLGLVISKELVELNGGKIYVESQPNQGTTVSFTLPLAQPKNLAQSKSTQPQKDSPSPEANAVKN